MTNTMLCGCVIISDNLGAYKIDYCPKHGAAPELCEVLKRFSRLEEFIRRTKGAIDTSRDLEHWFREDIENLKKALAKGGE